MNIRLATTLDIDALVSLTGYVQALHATAIPLLFRSQPPDAEVASAFHKMIEAPHSIWFIAEQEVPCGYLHAQFYDRPENWCRPATRVCNIEGIVVHPQARRKGIARNLISALKKEAEKRGVSRIELEVWSFNQEARAAYKRLGFQVFRERMEMTMPGAQ